MTTYFCDGLREVTILNGVARLQFQRLEAVQNGSSQELRAIPEFALALPVQGLVLALEMLEKARAQLAGQGIVKMGPPGESNGVSQPPQGKSPNFR